MTAAKKATTTNKRDKTEPVQVNAEMKRKIEKYLFAKKMKGEKATLSEFYSQAAEEKYQREKQ